MADSFFFYDLETTGVNPFNDRVMQFAGHRTDTDLNLIGEPVNVLIKLAGDVLPQPDAIMITGITPQSVIQDGLTEAEFLSYFYEQIVTPDTCFLGFNTIRFDDEFMRNLHYRNFYDPYEWHYLNNCGRWDLLDAVRMTRALRPEGISWPFTDEGKPTNRLELITVANGLDHAQAHDALSDVYATIDVAKLIHDKQPDLFTFLHDNHGKKQVAAIVEKQQPFVYTSGRYPGKFLHTTAAIMLAKHGNDALIYDLRHDPRPFMTMQPAELVEAWRYNKDRPEDFVRLPVKTLKYNRCPAIAPLGVIKDSATQERIELSIETINQHLAYLKQGHTAFAQNVLAAIELMDAERDRRSDRPTVPTPQTVDSMIYNGFVGPADKSAMQAVRTAAPDEIVKAAARIKDARLKVLAPLYKARNYPGSLTGEERQAWEAFVSERLFAGGQQSQLSRYFARLQELAAGELNSQKEFLLEELQLYGESVMPADATEQ